MEIPMTMTEFKIEDKPLPKFRRQRFQFDKMKVGQSFYIADEIDVVSARQAAFQYGRKHPGVKFSTRKDGKGWRLGRVK
jgi:hypothetical protein